MNHFVQSKSDKKCLRCVMNTKDLHTLLESLGGNYICFQQLGCSPVEVLSSNFSTKNANSFVLQVQKNLEQIGCFMNGGDKLEISNDNVQFFLEHKSNEIVVVIEKSDVTIRHSYSIDRYQQTQKIQNYISSEGKSQATHKINSDQINTTQFAKHVLGNDKISTSFAHLSPRFCSAFQVCAPYVGGAMAGGIASVSFVSAMSGIDILSFFGSGGLSLEEIEDALQQLSKIQGIWGINLLHSPHEPQLEEDLIDLFCQYDVKIISASAYMRLTPALIRYRIMGISEKDGVIQASHKIFAKISHPSVAKHFLEPPPEKEIQNLLQQNKISQEQAILARQIPMCDAITVEGDSGGHTDRRNPFSIFPVIKSLVEISHKKYQYPIFLGLAGGIGEPQGFWAALNFGADYVLLGSIHQSTIEAGTSPIVKDMLCQAQIDHFAYGVSPDMFEQGALVQVLKQGTMYAQRSQTLRTIYLQNDSLQDLSEKERNQVEKILGKSIEDVWMETVLYWSKRDSKFLQRAERDEKFKMALLFRWYLGLSSRWAKTGFSDRKKDFQIWSGPALGTFNQWVKGTPLEDPNSRSVARVVFAILEGVIALQSRENHHSSPNHG